MCWGCVATFYIVLPRSAYALRVINWWYKKKRKKVISFVGLFAVGLIASRLIVKSITLAMALTGFLVDLTLACSFNAYCSSATVCTGTSFIMDILKTTRQQQDPPQYHQGARHCISHLMLRVLIFEEWHYNIVWVPELATKSMPSEVSPWTDFQEFMVFPNVYGQLINKYEKEDPMCFYYHSLEGSVGMLSRIARQTLKHSVNMNEPASRIQFLWYTRIQLDTMYMNGRYCCFCVNRSRCDRKTIWKKTGAAVDKRVALEIDWHIDRGCYINDEKRLRAIEIPRL